MSPLDFLLGCILIVVAVAIGVTLWSWEKFFSQAYTYGNNASEIGKLESQLVERADQIRRTRRKQNLLSRVFDGLE